MARIVRELPFGRVLLNSRHVYAAATCVSRCSIGLQHRNLEAPGAIRCGTQARNCKRLDAVERTGSPGWLTRHDRPRIARCALA